MIRLAVRHPCADCLMRHLDVGYSVVVHAVGYLSSAGPDCFGNYYYLAADRLGCSRFVVRLAIAGRLAVAFAQAFAFDR